MASTPDHETAALWVALMKQPTFTIGEFLDAGPAFHLWLWEALGKEQAIKVLSAKGVLEQETPAEPTPEERTATPAQMSEELEEAEDDIVEWSPSEGDVKPEIRSATPPSSSSSGHQPTLQQSDQASVAGPSAGRKRIRYTGKGKAPEVVTERCQRCVRLHIPCMVQNGKSASFACKACREGKCRCERV
ncbi:hypothetical protein BD626DRAFT_514141 [Schizophyllum amplum]|uniref:Uncharacterized protein n=1 Tax=Schizophyllum amplum TaxID=97359 RepID=A0A550BYM2_9AGAR|nr:hypothetical protein BD626DRAFT_514141 [Auriculariopsis ampla]